MEASGSFVSKTSSSMLKGVVTSITSFVILKLPLDPMISTSPTICDNLCAWAIESGVGEGEKEDGDEATDGVVD